MAASNVGSFKKYFAPIKDPRVRRRTRHRLIDILVIAICAVIADCDDWQAIVLFAKEREPWFKRFLSLPNGIPSHDTFERVFTKINARAFQECCLQWLQDVSDLIGVKHMAIDGKTLRGSKRRTHSALHLVSAWATEAGMTLGQVAVDGKSNEITAIPKLLELLDVKGALVSIDAIGCQKEIAAQIVNGGGDYLLAVKGNQEHLLADIQATVTKALDGLLPVGTVKECTTRTMDHGREEKRWCVVIQHLEEIRDRDAWANVILIILDAVCEERVSRFPRCHIQSGMPMRITTIATPDYRPEMERLLYSLERVHPKAAVTVYVDEPAAFQNLPGNSTIVELPAIARIGAKRAKFEVYHREMCLGPFIYLDADVIVLDDLSTLLRGACLNDCRDRMGACPMVQDRERPWPGAPELLNRMYINILFLD